jgi:hypothetical protein
MFLKCLLIALLLARFDSRAARSTTASVFPMEAPLE